VLTDLIDTRRQDLRSPWGAVILGIVLIAIGLVMAAGTPGTMSVHRAAENLRHYPAACGSADQDLAHAYLVDLARRDRYWPRARQPIRR